MVINYRKVIAATSAAAACLTVISGEQATGVGAPRTVVVESEVGIVIDGVDTQAFPQVVLTVGVSGGLAALQESGETFKIKENDQDRPVEVLTIDNPDDLNVVVVFDKSGSMGTRPMRAAKDAALAFIDALPTEVDVGLVSFSSDTTVDVPVTQDRATLSDAVEALDSDGNTSLYDGVILAASLFDPAIERKVLVVLSDGGDNDSTATLEEAVAAVAGISVEMIELATPESKRSALDQLAAPLPVRSTEDPAQLEDLYTSVAQRLVGRVGLRYESLASPGSNISLVVTLGEGEAARSVSTEISAPVPPTSTTAAPSTSSPAIVLVEPETEDAGSRTLFRVLSFVLICGGLLVSVRFATDRRVRLARERLIPVGTLSRGKKQSRDLFSGLKQKIESSESQKKLVADIETLGLERSAGSVILTTLGLAFLLAVIGFILQGPILGLLLLLTVLMVARSRLSSKVNARKTEFISQLPETLGMLSSMLRTGYGLIQAMDAVVDEAVEPTKSWIGRVLIEVSTGRDITEALRSLALEIDSLDFDWVVAGIEISRDTGGDLAKTLETVAETIRDRDKLRGQIRALTAEGRVSAYVMLALPPGIGTMSYIINPNFFSVFGEPIGLALIGGAGILMVMGYFWMRSMIAKVTL